ncbi:hypothetical protein E2C01_100393 [Portunus trituberculatus]|uniref:Uncharacterized protein n=1 Tax=Portunus trituberculatus TaxID=210409 RepID=A0A5B7KC44_PORTR|nr:hypothetical protein [Portunus trituberculatus]
MMGGNDRRSGHVFIQVLIRVCLVSSSSFPYFISQPPLAQVTQPTITLRLSPLCQQQVSIKISKPHPSHPHPNSITNLVTTTSITRSCTTTSQTYLPYPRPLKHLTHPDILRIAFSAVGEAPQLHLILPGFPRSALDTPPSVTDTLAVWLLSARCVKGGRKRGVQAPGKTIRGRMEGWMKGKYEGK